MGLIAIVSASLYSFAGRDFEILGESFRQTAAERVAAARLEGLVAGGIEARPGLRPFDPDPGIARPLPGVRAEEEIREAGPGLLSVEVRVSWKGPGGREERLRVSTLVHRGGGR
jgi:hypothetical protein